MRKNLIVLVGLLLAAAIPSLADPFSFQLLSGPDLSAPAGGTISWQLQITNGSATQYLVIDGQSWTAALNVLDGTDDNFALFNPSILAPGASETDSFFSVTWLATPQTPTYSTSGEFVIQSEFCNNITCDVESFNSDVHLASTASISSIEAVPEPGTTLLLATGLVALSFRLRRRQAA